MTAQKASLAHPPDGPDAGLDALTVAIGRSARIPLLVLFVSAALWAVIAAFFGLIASIKFHAPQFLADHSFLTYGRVRPAYLNALIYGFCLQAALGVALWLFARLGRVAMVWPVLITAGAVFWNFGVTIGFGATLAGESTGFNFLEMRAYAVVPIFIGWLLLALCGLLTLHARTERRLHPSLWFLVAVLFWFPWIYSTANLLLLAFPVRGVAQAVIDWWYTQNLLGVCFDMFGFAALFYFVPVLAGRELRSRYLSLFAFWILILFTSWACVPISAPVPAWMPTISTITAVLNLLVLVAVAVNVYQTVGRFAVLKPGQPVLSFLLVGVLCFVLAGAMHIGETALDTSQLVHLTWFSVARWQFQIYGFLGLVMFGAIYYIVPTVTPSARLSPWLIKAQFWTAATGIALIAVPLAVSGVIEALQLQNPQTQFAAIMNTEAQFLRVTTIGDLLLLISHVLLLVNLGGVLYAVSRARLFPVYELATEDLFKPAEGKA